MVELFHYIHCPFCVRVRLACGYLDIPFKSTVIPYSDEETPRSIAGKKMLPILKTEDSNIINESLDIIKFLDQEQRLKQTVNVDMLLSELGQNIHSLVMPYWIWTPEFSPEDREYFRQKKEVKRGPFEELINNRSNFESKLNVQLKQLEAELSPFYKSEKLTLNDILIASHLWGLYILPEFQFPTHIHTYLQTIKKLCRFDNSSQFRSKPC